MILISHRGNINGKNVEMENHPSYIDTALNLWYDVEIDVWYIDGVLFLGHDNPQYEVSLEWLEHRSPSLWIHCKIRLLYCIYVYIDLANKQRWKAYRNYIKFLN